MDFDQTPDLVPTGSAGLRQRAEKGEYLHSVGYIATGQLADDEGMAHNLTLVEQRLELRIPVMKMIDPDRGIVPGNLIGFPIPAEKGARSEIHNNSEIGIVSPN
jgi:hypothetical protein